MSRERKYVSYKVQVENLDGSKQEFTFDSIDTSYKDMLDRYREIKDKFSDDKDVYCITFIGVKKDGSMKAVYPPKIVNSKENKVNETPFDEIKSILSLINKYDGELYENYKLWIDKKIKEMHHVLRDTIGSNDDDKLLLFAKEFKEILEERIVIKNRHQDVKNFKDILFKHNDLEKALEFKNHWNRRDKEKDINLGISEANICKSIDFSNEEEKRAIMNKLKNQGWDNILELPNNKIGYFNDYTPERRNEKNIKTIKFSQKIPKEKGSSIIITYCSMKEKMKIIKDLHDKYEKCENLEESGAIKLINRIA